MLNRFQIYIIFLVKGLSTFVFSYFLLLPKLGRLPWIVRIDEKKEVELYYTCFFDSAHFITTFAPPIWLGIDET